MTKPQKRPADPIGDPTDPRLAVGETWHVQLPSATQLATVEIDEITERTVVLRICAELGQRYDGAIAGRFAREKVEFIERVR